MDADTNPLFDDVGPPGTTDGVAVGSLPVHVHQNRYNLRSGIPRTARMASRRRTTSMSGSLGSAGAQARTVGSGLWHEVDRFGRRTISEFDRFGRRTISVSQQSHVTSTSDLASVVEENGRSDQCEDDLEEEEERTSDHAISNTETIIHLIKGNIGMGILTLPLAIRNAGLIGGSIGLGAIAFICVYCMHLLVKSAHKATAKRDNVTFLDYADTAEAAFNDAGGRWAKWSKFIRKLLNIFLCMSQIGSNAVYTLFMAQNIQPIIEHYGGEAFQDLNYRYYILMLFLPEMLLCSIKNLKYLSPFSVLANAIQFVGLGLIFYYMFRDPLPNSHTVPWFDSGSRLPLFFGTAIFAIEGISVVLPIENQMKKPKDMLGPVGVLNFSMVLITAMYIATGFFGYLKYGEDIKSSVTLNLPLDEIPAQLVLLLFAIAVFFSYALQFYVVMEIMGPNVIQPRVSEAAYPWAEYGLRVALTVLTFGLAASIPWLDLLVSLLGAVKMSTLSLMAPALIDTASNWSDLGRFKWKLFRNGVIFIFGFFGCVIGTYVSLKNIIDNFRHEADMIM